MFWSALLITISLVGFISWEMVQMLARAKAMHSLSEVVADESMFIQRLAAHKVKARVYALKMIAAWKCFWGVSVI